MLDKILELSTDIRGMLLYALVGGFGGLVYNLLVSERVSFFGMVKCVLVSAFTGFLAGIGCIHFGVDPETALFYSGVFGFAGGYGMLLILASLAKKMGVSPHDMEGSLKFLHMANHTPHHHNRTELTERLLKKHIITPEEYARMAAGQEEVSEQLLIDDKISGEEFDTLKEWITEQQRENPENGKHMEY